MEEKMNRQIDGWMDGQMDGNSPLQRCDETSLNKLKKPNTSRIQKYFPNKNNAKATTNFIRFLLFIIFGC